MIGAICYCLGFICLRKPTVLLRGSLLNEFSTKSVPLKSSRAFVVSILLRVVVRIPLLGPYRYPHLQKEREISALVIVSAILGVSASCRPRSAGPALVPTVPVGMQSPPLQLRVSVIQHGASVAVGWPNDDQGLFSCCFLYRVR